MSLSPLVAAALVAWFFWAARRVDPAGRRRRVARGAALAMLLWIALCWWLARDAAPARDARHWAVAAGALVPLVATAFALLLLPDLRGLVRLFVQRLPPRHTILVHTVRLAALVAIAEAIAGGLPTRVLVWAVPETLVGASALCIAPRAAELSDRALLAWNAAGALALVATAVGAASVLAATFIAPLLILCHLLSVAQIVRRSTPSFG